LADEPSLLDHADGVHLVDAGVIEAHEVPLGAGGHARIGAGRARGMREGCGLVAIVIAIRGQRRSPVPSASRATRGIIAISAAASARMGATRTAPNHAST